MVKEYYIISFIIIVIAIGLFVLSFEKRKPQIREVVLLAVLTTMAIVGRIIFFMTPQFKPCAAIIIITGVMLGKESGFLCGCLTAFLSGFFFGQGPWTPWQMFAFGVIGLLSAVIFGGNREKYAENKLIISIYGFLVTFILYGIIMDTATVVMYMDTPKISAFVASYASGILFNAIHGLSTLVFLFILSEEMFKKVKRIKLKFKMFCQI
jgi:energy-coupling factor transport system substrate-specific component